MVRKTVEYIVDKELPYYNTSSDGHTEVTVVRYYVERRGKRLLHIVPDECAFFTTVSGAADAIVADYSRVNSGLEGRILLHTGCDEPAGVDIEHEVASRYVESHAYVPWDNGELELLNRYVHDGLARANGFIGKNKKRVRRKS